jgi:hypothetical protein
MEAVQGLASELLETRNRKNEKYLESDIGKPNYEHDCDECTFLGSIPRAGSSGVPIDLWAHWGERIGERTVISRWSDNPAQYQSGIGAHHYSIDEALERAVALGVIPTEILVPVSIRQHVSSGVDVLEVFSIVEATIRLYSEEIFNENMPRVQEIVTDLGNRLEHSWKWMMDRRMVDAGSRLPGVRVDHYSPEEGRIQIGLGGRRIEPLTQQEIRVGATFRTMPFFKCDCDRDEDERSIAEDRAVERILSMITDECEGLSLKEQKAAEEALRDHFKDDDETES